jgi:predicted RNA-binding Zn ribbon-like protein
VRFSFHRGSLALDLVGTVGRRASDAPEERLPEPSALGTWLAEAGLAADTTPAAEDLALARALREAIHRAAAAVLDGGAVRRVDLAVLNRAALGLREGVPQLGPSLAQRWETDRPVTFALARVAADAIDLLAHRADRLARCELPGCGALLLSRSRGEGRRWCSMETCGNRAKVAAFRARQRAT